MPDPEPATPGVVPATGARTSRHARWVFAGFALLALLLLGFEHRMHLSGLIGWLPYLILLACPLMHFFMHRGHGHRRSHGKAHDGAEP